MGVCKACAKSSSARTIPCSSSASLRGSATTRASRIYKDQDALITRAWHITELRPSRCSPAACVAVIWFAHHRRAAHGHGLRRENMRERNKPRLGPVQLSPRKGPLRRLPRPVVRDEHLPEQTCIRILRHVCTGWQLRLRQEMPRGFQYMPAPASQSGGVSGFWQPRRVLRMLCRTRPTPAPTCSILRPSGPSARCRSTRSSSRATRRGTLRSCRCLGPLPEKGVLIQYKSLIKILTIRFDMIIRAQYVKKTHGARASCPGQRYLGTASSIMLRPKAHPLSPPFSPLRPGRSRRGPSPGPALRSPRPRCCRRGRRRTPPAQGRAQQPQGPCAFHIVHAPARRCRPGCRRCSCRRRCAPFRSPQPRRMQPAPRSALRCPSSSRCALCRCWSRRAECTGPRETKWPGCHQTACKTPAYKSTRPHMLSARAASQPNGDSVVAAQPTWKWPQQYSPAARTAHPHRSAQAAAPKQQQMQRQQVMPGLRALLVRPRVHLILQSRSLLHASNCYAASSYRGLVVVAVVRLAALVLGVAAVDLLVVGPKLSWQKTSHQRLAPPGTSRHFPWAVATRAPSWSSRRRSRSRLRPQHGQPRCAPPRKPQSHREGVSARLAPPLGPNGVSMPLAMGVARTAQMVMFLSIPSFAKPFCVQARKGNQAFSSRVVRVFGSVTCRQDQASEPGKRSTRTS